ncbi:putative monooxygenase [Nocardia nova SH22a]|uniref:Putative monooxygenase n=1 Tax=Nocardia nova SH22a TaxID=1415166 RepID=W5T828_9NOCA|nr:antibiotic biosynthesis monooxygenase family protein [Nocardia nova]AHH15470.1 putative monooxygenase [Nocardia nova SH22a]
MADDEPITLINVFEVPADQVDELIEDWRERARIMSTKPGFRDFRLHRAVSGDSRFQLVNVARWDSAQALRAAVSDPEFRTRRAEAITTSPVLEQGANPATYRVVAEQVADPEK